MNKQIVVSELDFNNIKESFKAFLKGQSSLSDYDFEGSNLSVLLDILSYNTHYNALYSNFALNESFLDSASKRESIISLANMIGYTARSATASTATIDVIVSKNSSETFLLLPKFTQFSGSKNNKTFYFYNVANTILTKESGVYIGRDIQIKEGTVNTESYLVTDTSKYIISNKNVDLSTLVVSVRESKSSAVYTTYTKAEDILEIKADSAVFFVKEIYDNNYEIYFGNDKIGKSVSNGNIVTLNYIITNNVEANDIKQFTCDDNLGGSVSVRTIKLSNGGDQPETIEDIKYNAPKLFNGTNRAVTAEDYTVLIKHNYPNVESMNVWGGQDNVPPVYGKVFCSIKPKVGTRLSSTEKELIKNDIINKRNIIGVTPEFVDPDFLNLQLEVAVYFDKTKTFKEIGDIASAANLTIHSYNNNELKKFESIFRFSKLSKLIDETDESILSNITKVYIRRSVQVFYNTNTPYVISIFNRIYNSGVPEESVTSTGFYLPGDSSIYYLEDDGVGNIRRFKYNNDNSKNYVNNQQGIVDYYTGKITITELPIARLVNNAFELIIKPASNDIISSNNTIVQLDLNNLNVTAIPYLGSNKDYVFTTSR